MTRLSSRKTVDIRNRCLRFKAVADYETVEWEIQCSLCFVWVAMAEEEVETKGVGLRAELVTLRTAFGLRKSWHE